MSDDLYEHRDTRVSVRLGASEAAVLAGATRLFAAHIARGAVTDENEGALMRDCVQQAIRLARACDNAIHAENEL